MFNDFKEEFKHILNQGLIKNNPLFVLALSLTPVLAVSDTLEKAFALGFTVLIIMIIVNLFVALFRSKISPEMLNVFIILILAFLVSVAEMIMQVRNLGLYQDLGIYLPLTAVSGLVLQRARTYANEHNALHSLVDGFAYGVGFLGALVIVTIIRVITTTGSITLLSIPMRLFDPVYSFSLANTAFGALLIVGLLLGIFKTFQQRGESK